jgi:hypothetical protein
MTSLDPISFTKDYIAYRSRRQGVYPIPEVDWTRLKRLTAAIKPVRRIYQNLSSAMFGVSASALLTLIASLNTPNIASWIQPTNWAIFLGSMIVGSVFLHVDSKLGEQMSAGATDVLSEMGVLEATFEPADVPTEQQPPNEPKPSIEFIDQVSFKVADRVFHSKLGFGVVTGTSSIPETGEQLVLTRFKDGEERRVVARPGVLKLVVGDIQPTDKKMR